mmetsp:Transcript_57284/g.104675  ORF Transcript_57284/g.104675 Transcript_57284/m.104675 type:complete len:90 (-) Transcript_57284:94-363(-)
MHLRQKLHATVDQRHAQLSGQRCESEEEFEHCQRLISLTFLPQVFHLEAISRDPKCSKRACQAAPWNQKEIVFFYSIAELQAEEVPAVL